MLQSNSVICSRPGNTCLPQSFWCRIWDCRISVEVCHFSGLAKLTYQRSLGLITRLTHHRKSGKQIFDEDRYPDWFVEVAKSHCIHSKARLVIVVRVTSLDMRQDGAKCIFRPINRRQRIFAAWSEPWQEYKGSDLQRQSKDILVRSLD